MQELGGDKERDLFRAQQAVLGHTWCRGSGSWWGGSRIGGRCRTAQEEGCQGPCHPHSHPHRREFRQSSLLGAECCSSNRALLMVYLPAHYILLNIPASCFSLGQLFWLVFIRADTRACHEGLKYLASFCSFLKESDQGSVCLPQTSSCPVQPSNQNAANLPNGRG